MLCLRRHFQPTIIRIVASTALACMGSVALASASQAAAVTFNYTGADVSYTISPGTYRISVFGAQGGSTEGEVGLTAGGRGAEASAIYQIGQTLDLRIGVGGTAPGNEFAAGGGGASFVDFEIGDPGLTILLLVGGGGGGAYDNAVEEKVPGGDGKTASTDPGANGMGLGGGGGGGYSTDGQSFPLGGQGGTSLASGGAPGQQLSPGGFGGGGAGFFAHQITGPNGGGGGGGFNGGNSGFGDNTGDFFASQGGTSFVNNSPDGCGPDNQGPACFIGGLFTAVGETGNGRVIIEQLAGSPVPEPSTWAMMAIGFAGLGFMGCRGSRKATTVGAF
jgi:Glycine rich protein/PEP-CTERM motif